jgi:hypothetical protein
MLTPLLKNDNIRFHKNNDVEVNQNSLTFQSKGKGLEGLSHESI